MITLGFAMQGYDLLRESPDGFNPAADYRQLKKNGGPTKPLFSAPFVSNGSLFKERASSEFSDASVIKKKLERKRAAIAAGIQFDE